MAQPTPYNRLYDFSDYQTVNPTKPLRGSEVDAEFDALKLTTDQLRANAALIQRDDGKLANQVVAPDSLSAGALAMIHQGEYRPRGAWAASVIYELGDVVDFNAGTYLCVVEHTSSATFVPDKSRWLLIANGALTGQASAIDLFEGNGTTTAYTLTYNYANSNAAVVFVGGVAQIPVQDFTISGTALTFVVAPPAPSVAGRKNVMVRGASLEVQLVADSAASFATAAAASALAASNSAASADASEAQALASKNAAAVSEANASDDAAATASAVAQAVDGEKDLFVAGVGYTKGTTTQLTLAYAPAKSGTVKVFFDGVFQHLTEWSLAGNVITFPAAIPADKVEVHYVIPSQFVGLSNADLEVLGAAQAAAQAGATTAQDGAVTATAAKTAAETARDAAQFHAGIYTTTALGLAATVNEQYFSVPGATSSVLSLYKNNAGTAQLIGSYPSSNVAKLGRVQFTDNQTTYFFTDPVGTTVQVGWSILRFLKGDSTVRAVDDRALSTLDAGKALYIDVGAEMFTYAVQEATIDAVAVDVVLGQKILLVCNYSGGYLMGELVPMLMNTKQAAATATAQSAANAAAANATASRRIIVGEITSIIFGGTNATVSISSGTVYKENNGGSPEKSIAPLSGVSLNPHSGIVVDLVGGSLDGLGRIIPVVVPIASGAQVGWQTGSKYILAVNNGASVHGLYRLSDANAKAARRLIAGRVTRTDWSGASVTVNISEGRAYKERNGGLVEKVIAPMADQVLALDECLIVDLAAGSVDASGRVIPVKLNVAQQAAGGWQTEDKYILAANGGVGVLVGEYERYTPASTPASGYPANEVVVIQRPDEVDVYMKGSNPISSRYLRYRMQRKPDAAIGSDVWRWNEVWEVNRNGDFSFSTVIQVCNAGENETAILQTGKPDFMGGTAHGDEVLFEVAMLIDGTKVDLGGTGNYRCKRVEFLQGSNMFEVGTATPQSNRLAKNYKRWLFESSAVELFQNVFWEASVTLQDTYMTMLTLLRTSGVTQISDKGYRHPKYTEENISTAGFTNIYDKTPIAKASGPSGFSAEVEILDGWDKPNREFNFSPSASYNKFYFDYTGPGYATQIGEQFVARAVYRLDTKN